jgi:hypothetical protein
VGLLQGEIAVDEQVVGMIRDSLERLENTCTGIREDMNAHADQDATYWKKIDQVEGQISLVKWFGGSVSISGLGAWLFSHFGK